MDSETYAPQSLRLRGRSAGFFDEALRISHAVSSPRVGALALSARDVVGVRPARPDWRCRIGLHRWESREMNPSKFIRLWDAPSCARCGKAKR